jgi:hypothetical protein
VSGRTKNDRLARPSSRLAAARKMRSLVQPGTGDLAAKHRQLVTEHDDLELFELARTQTQRRHRERTPEQQVQQRHHHDAASLRPSPKRLTLRLRPSSEALSSNRMDLRTRQVRRA